MKIKFSILLVSMVLAISSCGQITELTKPEPDPLLLQACSKLSLFIDLAGADSRESSTWAQEYQKYLVQVISHTTFIEMFTTLITTR
jgi:hypothetical protein